MISTIMGKTTRQRNFRQTIEGMPLFFNPSAADELKAVIQFNAGGPEPGVYHLRIDSGRCTFHVGKAFKPTLTIKTPSEIWLQIGSGELSGEEALLKGLYTVEGDSSLLMRFSEIFKVPEPFTIQDESEPAVGLLFQIFRRKGRELNPHTLAGRRPAGPLPIAGMLWLTFLFVPWTLFWVLFDMSKINPWISSGLPFILMSLIVIYRIIFNSPTWSEWASWLFFLIALVFAPLIQNPIFLYWGSVIGTLYMGGMWLTSMSSLVKMPFCAEYSKWGFVRGLWVHSQFIETNMAISLVWGWELIFSSGFGMASKMMPSMNSPFTILRYLLMVPAIIFTKRYQKGAMDRQFADIDKAIALERFWAYVGLVLTCVLISVILLFLQTTFL